MIRGERYWIKRDFRDWVVVTWIRSLSCGLAIVLDPERGEYPVSRDELKRHLPWTLKGRKAMAERARMPQ